MGCLCSEPWGRGGMAALALLPAQHLPTVTFERGWLLTVLLAGSLCGDTKGDVGIETTVTSHSKSNGVCHHFKPPLR